MVIYFNLIFLYICQILINAIISKFTIVNSEIKPPQGSKFLGYLYRELTRLTERDYISLMLFILRRCCHVYLK